MRPSLLGDVIFSQTSFLVGVRTHTSLPEQVHVALHNMKLNFLLPRKYHSMDLDSFPRVAASTNQCTEIRDLNWFR